MKQFTLLLCMLFCGCALFLSSCASVSGFQTGRTSEKDGGEFAVVLNMTRTPDFNVEIDEELKDVLWPNLELGARYGLTDNFDVGIKASTFLNFLIDVKYQLVGDKESPFALSIGAGVGSFGFVSTSGGLYNFQLPLYASFHPSEKFCFYVSPRYIGQFGTTFTDYSGLLNYTGANVGFLFGKEIQFGLDLGYYGLRANGITQDEDYSTNLLNIGMGVLFKF